MPPQFSNRLPALEINAGKGEIDFCRTFETLPARSQATLAAAMVASLPADVRDKLPTQFKALAFIKQAMEAGAFSEWRASLEIHIKRESSL